MAANKVVTIVRAKRGRKAGTVDSSTLLARAALEQIVEKGTTVTVNVNDDDGKLVESFDAFHVTPDMVGKASSYTGLPGLVAGWAKSSGRTVKVITGSDGYLLRLI